MIENLKQEIEENKFNFEQTMKKYKEEIHHKIQVENELHEVCRFNLEIEDSITF